MATNLGSVYGELILDSTKWNNALNGAQKQLNSFASNTSKGLSSLSGITSNLGSSFVQASKQAALLGTAGLAAVATGLSVVGIKALNTAGQLESAEMGFRTLLGSAEKANEVMLRIQREAAATPFEIPGLTAGAQALTAITKDGNKAIDILLDVGKAVAASGKGQADFDRVILNLQQVASTGKLTEMDVKQFQSAIPIFNDILLASGLTVEKLQDSSNAAELLFGAFKKAGKEGGLTSRAFIDQAGTFSQLMSNFSDTFTILSVKILKESGAFDAIKNLLGGIIDFMTNNTDKIVRFAGVMGNLVYTIGELLDGGGERSEIAEMFTYFTNGDWESAYKITDFFTGLVNNLKIFGQWVIDNKDLILQFLTGMAIAFGTLAVIGGVIVLLNLLFNPLTLIVLAAGAVYMAFMNWDKIVAFITSFVDAGVAKFNEFKDGLILSLQSGAKAIGDFFTITLPEILSNIPVLIGEAFRWALDALIFGIYFLIVYVMIGFPMFIDSIKNGIASIPSIMTNIWESAKSSMIRVWEAIVLFFSQAIPNFINNAGIWLSQLLPKVITMMTTFKDNMSKGAKNAWTSLEEEIKTWPQKLFNWGANIAKSFSDGFGKLDQYLKDKAKAALESAKKMLKGESPPKEGPFREIDKWGYNVGMAWSDGLIKGIGGFSSNLSGVANDISSTLNNGQGQMINSPVFNVNIGVYAGSNMEKRALAKELWDSLQDYNRSIGANIVG